MNDCAVYTSGPEEHGSFYYLRNYVQSIFMVLIGCLIKLKAALSGQWPLTFPDKASCHISLRRGPVSAGFWRADQWETLDLRPQGRKTTSYWLLVSERLMDVLKENVVIVGRSTNGKPDFIYLLLFFFYMTLCDSHTLNRILFLSQLSL